MYIVVYLTISVQNYYYYYYNTIFITISISTNNTPRTYMNHLPFTAVSSNPDRDFEFFHAEKLSS